MLLFPWMIWLYSVQHGIRDMYLYDQGIDLLVKSVCCCLVLCRRSHACELPNGEKVPDLIVERLQGAATCWRRTLVEVDDDLESRYLRAQRSTLDFELLVPNHGEIACRMLVACSAWSCTGCRVCHQAT